MSHFWEMKLLQEDRPALLHGAKVGAATVIVARRYEQIRRLTRSQVIEKLKAVPMPRRDQEIEHIRAAYHPRPAGQIITAHAPFLNISPLEYDQLCEKIVKHWTDIQQIAMTVPAADTLAGWLRAAGGTVDPQAMGLSEDEVRLAAANGHYLRNRFTIAKLSRMLGMQ